MTCVLCSYTYQQFQQRVAARDDIQFVTDPIEAEGAPHCLACYATPQTASGLGDEKPLKFATSTKDEWCHLTHLLMYGENTYKDCCQ